MKTLLAILTLLSLTACIPTIQQAVKDQYLIDIERREIQGNDYWIGKNETRVFANYIPSKAEMLLSPKYGLLGNIADRTGIIDLETGIRSAADEFLAKENERCKTFGQGVKVMMETYLFDYNCGLKDSVNTTMVEKPNSPKSSNTPILNSPIQAKPVQVITETNSSQAQNLDDIAVQLKKLKELKDLGVLTNSEYESKRKSLADKL